MDFSNRIINARKEKGLSQEALAELIGVSRQAVSKWETGEAKPDVDKLIALCAVLELSMDYLCLGKEPAAAPPAPSPAPGEQKESPALKIIRMLLITILASLAIIALVFIAFQYRMNNPFQMPITAQMLSAERVLDRYTIYSVRAAAEGADLTPTITGSVAYIHDNMGIQLILEYENFPDMEPVILHPELSDGQFQAAIPRECYGFSFRVAAVLTLDDAQRRVPLMTGLEIDESGCTYSSVINQ